MAETRNKLVFRGFVWIIFATGGLLAIFAALVLLHDDVLMQSNSTIAKTLKNHFFLLVLICLAVYLGILILASRKLNRKSRITARQVKGRIPWTATIIAVVLFLIIIGYLWLNAMSQLG